MPTRFHTTLAQGLASMPGPDKDQYDVLLRHGTMTVGLYAPRGIDDQTPHTRDAGEGWFVNGPDRHRFAPGDVLLVPAAVEHRFEEFSDDLALWVVFYGPEGGEVGGGTQEVRREK